MKKNIKSKIYHFQTLIVKSKMEQFVSWCYPSDKLKRNVPFEDICVPSACICVIHYFTVIMLYSALLSNKTNQCIQKTVSRVPNACRWGKYWIWGHMVWDWELIPPKSSKWKTEGSPSLFKLNFYLKNWKIMLILTKLKVPKELKPLKRFVII